MSWFDFGVSSETDISPFIVVNYNSVTHDPDSLQNSGEVLIPAAWDGKLVMFQVGLRLTSTSVITLHLERSVDGGSVWTVISGNTRDNTALMHNIQSPAIIVNTGDRFRVRADSTNSNIRTLVSIATRFQGYIVPEDGSTIDRFKVYNDQGTAYNTSDFLVVNHNVEDYRSFSTSGLQGDGSYIIPVDGLTGIGHFMCRLQSNSSIEHWTGYVTVEDDLGTAIAGGQFGSSGNSRWTCGVVSEIAPGYRIRHNIFANNAGNLRTGSDVRRNWLTGIMWEI